MCHSIRAVGRAPSYPLAGLPTLAPLPVGLMLCRVTIGYEVQVPAHGTVTILPRSGCLHAMAYEFVHSPHPKEQEAKR